MIIDFRGPIFVMQIAIIHGKMILAKVVVKMGVLYGGMANIVLNIFNIDDYNRLKFLMNFFYRLDDVKTTATTGCSMTTASEPMSWECKWNFQIVE